MTNLCETARPPGTALFDKEHSRIRLTQESKVKNLGAYIESDGTPAATTPPGEQRERHGVFLGGLLDFLCFSAETTVQLENGSRVSMRELQIGDVVKVDSAKNKYEAVYAFAKRDATLSAEYLKLEWKTTSNGKKNGLSGELELSHKHMLKVASPGTKDWKIVPVSKLKIGDEIQVDGPGGIAKVSSIVQVSRTGAYAPLTFSGQIVASNVQASVYVSYQNSEYLMLGSGTSSTPVFVSYQWMAQSLLIPVRWIGASVAAPLKIDVFWWLPSFFLKFEKAIVSLLAMPAPVLLPFAIPAVAVMGISLLFESILLALLSHKLLTTMVFLAGVTFHKYWKASGMRILASGKKVV